MEGSITWRGWDVCFSWREGLTRIIPIWKGESRSQWMASGRQKHYGLGFVNKHLGQAYLDVGKFLQSVQLLGTAYNTTLLDLGLTMMISWILASPLLMHMQRKRGTHPSL